MTPETKDLVGQLNGYGLNYLADLVSTVGSTNVDSLEEFISERTSLEITDLQQLKELTPEQVEELKILENDYKRELLHLTIEDAKVAHENTAGARDLLAQSWAHGMERHSKFLYWCGGLTLIVSVIYLFCITFLQIPQENVRFADTVLGFLMGNCMGAVINFFFGSSLPTFGNNKGTFSVTTKKK